MGFGTALADATYAALAAAGFAAFTSVLSMVDVPLKVVGGLFMLWLGWRGMRAPAVTARAARVDARDLLGTFAATYLLTLANPATIFSFVAIFAGFGLAEGANPVGFALVVAGVFVGSLLWWLALSGTVATIRHKLPERFARVVAIVSGLVLVAFGLVALGSILPFGAVLSGSS